MRTCERCQQSKLEIEFNALIRYQRPIYDPYTDYCATCYLNQLRITKLWRECVDTILMRLEHTDDKLLARFGASLDELKRPLTDWLELQEESQ